MVGILAALRAQLTKRILYDVDGKSGRAKTKVVWASRAPIALGRRSRPDTNEGFGFVSKNRGELLFPMSKMGAHRIRKQKVYRWRVRIGIFYHHYSA